MIAYIIFLTESWILTSSTTMLIKAACQGPRSDSDLDGDTQIFANSEDMPPLDVDAANVFSKSERILQEHVRQHDINAIVVKDLIQRVIHHRDFNANEVNHDYGMICTSA